MPYASVADLPESIRSALPAHGQSIFMAAFNAAFKEHDGDEQIVNAIAWSAVKRMYHKNDKGEWVRKASEETDNLVPFDNAAEFTGIHDITLQTLETRHPHPNYPDGVYYAPENFEGTEREWESDGLAVFVPPGQKVQHVDHAAFARDPHGEAARLGYYIAGRLNNTLIAPDDQGKPRVTSQVLFTDPEAEKFASKRQLGLSSAFDAAITPDGKMSGKIVPNHVLFFLKCAGKSDGFCGIPNDKGSGFNNLESTMADESTTTMLEKILGHVTPKENPLQKTVDNLQSEIEKRDVQIDALTKENEALKADKARVDNVLAEQEKTRKDTQWAAVKNLYQPVMFHKPEDEAAHRLSFEKDPVAFQLANVGNLAPTGTKPKAEGKEAVGNLGGDDKPIDMVAERGEYDPINHVFLGRK